MNRYWKSIMCPIINLIKAQHIVEIGSDEGVNTKNILDYCTKSNAHLTSIDPSPNFDIEQLKLKYREKFKFHKSLSLDVLPTLNAFDVILIDGDHNWYTVYNELKIIEKSFKGKTSYPLIFLHDVDWPYARRDMYYNPKTIPNQYTQYYKKLGIDPHNETLVKDGGLNAHLFNAYFSNTPRNGVLTAIEDFISESNLEFTFIKIPLFYGLGILFIKDIDLEKKIIDIINNSDLFQLIENEFIETQISLKYTQVDKNNFKNKNDYLVKVNETQIQQINNLQEEKQNQEQQINNLQEEKENQYREVLKLTTQNISNELKIKDIENKINDIENENQNLKTKLNEYKINIQTVTSQINLLYSETEINKNQLQKSKNQNHKYSEEINKLESQIKKLNSQKNNLQLELNEYKNKLQEDSIKNQKQTKEINKLNTKLQISDSQKNIINTELYEEKKSLQEYSIKNQTYINEINDLKKEIELKNSKSSELISIKNKQQNEINDLKKEIELKNSKLSELISIKNKQQNEIKELENKNNLQQNNINKNISKIDELESSNSWKITKPLRKLSNLLKYKRKNNKEQH